jgi:hypothetical protein
MFGGYVGYVKLLDGEHVIVGRPAADDIRVPSTAWKLSSDNRLVLNVAADEVNQMGWVPERRLPVNG